MTPKKEQEIFEIIESMPDFIDRVSLLILIRDQPIEMSELARKLLSPIDAPIDHALCPDCRSDSWKRFQGDWKCSKCGFLAADQ